MAYNIDESINVQGSPEIGVWHEPEFKKYQVFSNNNGTIILPERLSKEYSPRLICDGIAMNRVYDITLLTDNNFYVDYDLDRIYVGEGYTNQVFQVKGYFIGYTCIWASKVIYKESDNILKDLKSLLDKNDSILFAIEEYGDYTNVLYTLSTTTDRCNEILARVEEKLNLINTTDNHFYTVTQSNWLTNSNSSINYKYYYDIEHNFATKSIIVGIYDTSGFKVSDSLLTYRTEDSDTLRLYCNSKINISVVISYRCYNPVNSTTNNVINNLRTDIEQARLDTADEEIYNTLQDRLDADCKRRKSLENDVINFKEETNTNINAFKGEVNSTINTFKEETNTNIDNSKAYMINEINKLDTNLKSAFQVAIDENSLRQCLNFISNGMVKGRTIFLYGKFTPSEPFLIPSGTEIIGMYNATIYCDKVNNIFRNKTTSNDTGYCYKNYSIKNITFDGNGLTNNCTALAFIHGKFIKIDNCTFTNFNNSWHCIELNACEDVWIENNSFDKCGLLDGNNTEIIQIDFAGSKDQYPFGEINLDNTHCSNIYINDNLFRNIYTTTGVIGNHTYYNDGSSKYHRNIYIEGNTFEKCQNCYYLFDVKGLSINNNHFNVCLNAIKLKNQTGLMDSITINGNIFRGDKHAKYFGEQTDGRFLWNINNTSQIIGLTCTGNSIKFATRHGIGGAFKDSVISNNVITDIGTDTNGGYGIYLYGCENCMVIGNTGRDYQIKAIMLGDNDNLSTNNNKIAFNSGAVGTGSNVGSNNKINAF